METPATSREIHRWPHALPGWLAEGGCALALFAAVLLVYSPALHGGFLWDDDSHISADLPLRSLNGLWKIWFKPGATMQYYPLSFTGFWAGYHLWGLNTTGYHLTNEFLHSLAAVLLWQVFKRLKLRGALLAGALFALHPVNVMSVAWMTEFKNTLSGSLALATVWAYLRFEGLGVYATSDGPKRSWRWYAVMVAFFQLAMFAKTAVSFVPVSLLLIAWWQRERIGWREIAPLLPLVGIVAAMGSITLFIERTSGGASGADFSLSLPERIIVSGHSFWFYLGKLFFSARLTFIYPRWQIDAGDWRQYLYPAATVLFLSGLWWKRRLLGKGLWAAAMHFYVSTSMLVLVTVLYMMRFAFVSDHWQYFGTMGVMPVIASAVVRLLDWRGWWGRPAGNAAAAALLALLGILSWWQSAMYSDASTLYTTTIKRNPGCWMAWNNLGLIFLQNSRLDEAMSDFQKALDIKPDYADAQMNLGVALAQKGRLDEAVVHYQEALDIKPDFAQAQNNFGIALFQKGQVDAAIIHYQKALDIEPGFAQAQNDLANALAQKGRVDEAIVYYQKVLDINPRVAEIHYNLANALYQKRRLDEAIAHYQEALDIKPDFAEAHDNLGTVLDQKGRLDDAIRHFRKALEISPGFADARGKLGLALFREGQWEEAIRDSQIALKIDPHNPEFQINLAYALATCPQDSLRNGAKAVELAEQANQATKGGNPIVLRTLAAAYAETGKFSEAVTTAHLALDLAYAQSNAALANQLQSQIALYQAGKPFHDNDAGK